MCSGFGGKREVRSIAQQVEIRQERRIDAIYLWCSIFLLYESLPSLEVNTYQMKKYALLNIIKS